jgi:hypothetical protein
MADLPSSQADAWISAGKGQSMAAKLSAGDTIGMSGEVTIIHDDGSVTVRLNGYDFPVTTRPEFLTLIAKRPILPGRRKRLWDRPD